MQRLRALLEDAGKNKGIWSLGQLEMLGNIPEHYKRISCSAEEAKRLAVIGGSELYAAFDFKTYFTQAVIAGGIFSGDYDTLVIVSPSQYGKSLLMAHIALLIAYKGSSLTVAASTADKTEIIMSYVRHTLKTAAPDIKDAVVGETMKKIDRLDMSLSKSRVSFACGGYIDAITLGDTYNDISHNKAVGRGTGYIIDEAALLSEAALSEVSRRELSRIDGKKELLVMISNPHQPGYFYDALTQEDPGERTLIVWMDALTACQEGRWTAEHILGTETAKRMDTRTRYLMCELPTEGQGMFPSPKASDPQGSCVHVLGVDAAYKGKDNIELCDVEIRGRKLHVREVATIKKDNWIDGVTSEDIIKSIARVYSGLGALYVCVDVGQGIWLVQGLAKIGIRVKGIHFGSGPTRERVRKKHYAATNASNKRAEMHFDLQSLMEEGLITFDPKVISDIKDVLPLVTYKRKASGTAQVRPKQEIKAMIGKSPDKLDAILLAIHSAILLTEE